MDFTRTAFLTGVSAVLAAPRVAGAALVPPSTIDPAAPSRGTPKEALKFLEDGNRRFLAGGWRRRPRPSAATPQRPWAALLTCADTRVAPEIVFDARFGDLFVCRTAGNIADNDVTGSIEYAVAAFHAPLVVVVAHSGCGACDAAIKTFDDVGDLPAANILSVVRTIMPAVSRIRRDDPNRIRRVEETNAQLMAAGLAGGPILAPAIANGKLLVTWAFHELKTGIVTMGPVPASAY